ncbi:hypothetical protein [Variovorax sp. DT-64]
MREQTMKTAAETFLRELVVADADMIGEDRDDDVTGLARWLRA